MKIGLVLFGHLRSFRNTHSSFQQLRDVLKSVGEVDIFCHTWDIEESVTVAWWKEHKPDDPPPSTVNAGEIISIYKPVQYLVEPSRQFENPGYEIDSTIPVAGILSMLHSQKQAFDLLTDYEKQNNFRYDVIIKSRYDLLYEIASSFAQVPSRSVSGNCLFLPSSNPYELTGSSSDVFAIGPRLLMEQYFTFCDNFKEAIALYKDKGYRHFVPELCMTIYLDHTRVNHEELSGLRIHILRSSGEKFQINTERNFPGNNPHCFHEKVIRSNMEILPQGTDISAINNRRLAKKYTSWIDTEAGETTLNLYASLYDGFWPGSRPIARLAKKSKTNKIFTTIVMKDFFEGAIRKARYGLMKVFFLVIILTIAGGAGFYYVRIWKRRIFGN